MVAFLQPEHIGAVGAVGLRATDVGEPALAKIFLALEGDVHFQPSGLSSTGSDAAARSKGFARRSICNRTVTGWPTALTSTANV
jgi:hypothetical protein